MQMNTSATTLATASPTAGFVTEIAIAKMVPMNLTAVSLPLEALMFGHVSPCLHLHHLHFTHVFNMQQADLIAHEKFRRYLLNVELIDCSCML